jgi:hypothetical protein
MSGVVVTMALERAARGAWWQRHSAGDVLHVHEAHHMDRQVAAGGSRVRGLLVRGIAYGRLW